MKAMILAAGLGTRLRPLTNDRPKALVTVAGHTLLEIALLRLRKFGVTEVIVNAHHFADSIVDFLQANENFGMRIEVSREEELLDTGGGLKHAADFFLRDGNSEPFFLHNADVLSTIDLGRMMEFHTQSNSLATLAVQERKTSRYLLFDEYGQLCGRRAEIDGELQLVRPTQHPLALAFCGIHVLSPQIFSKMSEGGAFSIISAYLRLSGEGEKILAFRADDCYWRDLGKPEHILQATKDIATGGYPEFGLGRARN